MTTPTVIQMVRLHLQTNGYGGLVADDIECGCELGDLAPCGEIGGGCQAGYRHVKSESPHDFVISTSPEAPNFESES